MLTRLRLWLARWRRDRRARRQMRAFISAPATPLQGPDDLMGVTPAGEWVSLADALKAWDDAGRKEDRTWRAD